MYLSVNVSQDHNSLTEGHELLQVTGERLAQITPCDGCILFRYANSSAYCGLPTSGVDSFLHNVISSCAAHVVGITHLETKPYK
jgi:hypothetical protein